MAGWWGKLFGRGAAAAPPSTALAAPVEPLPEPPTGPEPELAPEVPSESDVTPEEDGEISTARLDAALERLREQIPPAPEG